MIIRPKCKFNVVGKNILFYTHTSMTNNESRYNSISDNELSALVSPNKTKNVVFLIIEENFRGYKQFHCRQMILLDD